MALRNARVVGTHGVQGGAVFGRRLNSPDIIESDEGQLTVSKRPIV